jgi:subtilisin family serine protease
MANENQFIRTELHFAGEDELKIIRDELAITGAKIIGEYDGLIEAELPVSSLEVLKKKHILMDFPNKLPKQESDDLELFNIPDIKPVKERTAEESTWISNFKKKASKSYIDTDSNIVKLKSGDTEEVGADNDVETERDKNFFPESAEGDFEMVTISDDTKDEQTSLANEDLYLVTFKGPLNSTLRSDFKEHNLVFTSHFDQENKYCYTAYLTKAQHHYLVNLEITGSIRKLEIENKLTDNLVKELAAGDSGFETLTFLKIFDIVLSDEKYLEKVSETIRLSNEASIIDSGLNIIRIETNPESNLMAALAGSPYVSSLSLYEPPTLYCDVSRKIVGLDYINNNSSQYFGDAEIVGVIDSGIDATHVDLTNRIQNALQYGMGSVQDMAGHGTHVAGIICGDGTASNGKIKGIAPKAKLVTIGIVNSSGQLDLPVDIGKLLKLAVDKNAKIINLSLGKKVSGEYQLGSYSVDKFVYENPEILVVVAAGNEGKDNNGNIAYKTVGAPATAKNVLTVGATSGRRQSPVINKTWGNLKPASFPSPPLNSVQLISPQDHPSIGSSTGPTDFDSIKPEVVAPGTYILSAKASASNISASSSEYFDNNYTFKTGTSMATPLVSGMAALVREYLRIVHNNTTPTSSLIKAIIIGTCNQIENYRKTFSDGSLEKVGFPDFDQGFGMVDLNKLLNEKSVELKFADILNNDVKALESRAPLGGAIKSTREYEIELKDNASDLSVTLTWIDPPARGIQNNLQLAVKMPSNDWRLGNMEHTYKKDKDFDTLFDLKPLDKYNNSEKVLIKNPPAGKYLIRVTAQNTLSRQGYSLAAIGNIINFTER